MKGRGGAGEALGFLLAGPSPVLRLCVRLVESRRLGVKYWRKSCHAECGGIFLKPRTPESLANVDSSTTSHGARRKLLLFKQL